MCDNTGAHVVGTTSDTSDQILNITQELLNHRANDTIFIQNLFQDLENKTTTHTDMLNGSISQVSQ